MKKEINFCQICIKKKLKKIFSLGKLPLCDDLIKIGSRTSNINYPINISFCRNCKTAYNTFKIIENKLFPKTYHYRSSLTKDVLNGMHELVNDVERKFGNVKNKVVLDIGCNDGSLLNFFKTKKAITLGVDPTNAIKDNTISHNFLLQNFFNLKTAKIIKKKYKNIDFIVFTNVFAHIYNFKDLIKSLKYLISPDTKIIIENHYLGSVIKLNQFDTFYHEHPRTYSLTSFLYIAKLLNLNLTDFKFPKRYGGNIRVFYSNKKIKNTKKLKKYLLKEKVFFLKLKNMKKDINKWIKNKRNIIRKIYIKNGKKIVAKAFPGRATILINLLKVENYLSAVYEKDMSPKIGYYVPGTKIPILKDSILFRQNDVNYIINLAWHISKEIKIYLKKNFVNSKIINIVEKSDFK